MKIEVKYIDTLPEYYRIDWIHSKKGIIKLGWAPF